MKRFGSAARATAPYVLPATKTALQTVQYMNSLVHAPCVAPTIGLALQIVNVVDAMKTNKEECAVLKDRIAQLTLVAAKPWEGKADSDIPADTKTAIESLRESFENIKTDLESYTKASRLKRILLTADLSCKIRAATAKLDYAMQLFQVNADIIVGMKADMIISGISQLAIGGENSPGKSVPATSTTLPPKPEVFLGRDIAVENLVGRLVSTTNGRFPVMGPGGIGKTSLILAILNDPRVVEAFGEHRHWVPCVEAISFSLLADLLGASLGAPKGSPDRLADVITFLRASNTRRVIVFDNFETPWDLEERRAEIDTLLRSVASFQSVSIVITMRATQPPPCLKWTKTNVWTLLPLTKDDAKQLFLELSPETVADTSLDQLLAALDCVPLGITLMANLTLYGETPAELIRRWNDKKEGTRVLNLGPDRLSSLEVSIKLSLDSPVMKRNPEAFVLLQILSMLPAGAWRGWLTVIAPDLQAQSALIPLFQTALASHNVASRTVRVLSPIRTYMLHHHPLENPHRSELHEGYFLILSQTPLGPDDPRWTGWLDMLSEEDSNLEAILVDALEVDEPNQSSALNSCLLYAMTQQANCLRLELIQAAIRQARRWTSPELPRCLLELGKILSMRDQSEKAASTLTEAREAFMRNGDKSSATECLQSLGDILYLQDEYDKAEETYKEAEQVFTEIGEALGAAQCLRSLSKIYRIRGEYDKAESTIFAAWNVFTEKSNPLGEAQCLQVMGDILYTRRDFDNAEFALTEARKIFLENGDNLGAAQCLRSFGNVLIMREAYDKAEPTIAEALKAFTDIGNALGAAQCIQSLGDIFYMRDEDEQAESAYKEAEKAFAEIGNAFGVAQCLRSRGIMLYTLNQYERAEPILASAKEGFLRLGLDGEVTICQQTLDKVALERQRASDSPNVTKSDPLTH